MITKIGVLWLWEQTMTLPQLTPLPSFTVTPNPSPQLLTSVFEDEAKDIANLSQTTSTPYLAYIDNLPVALGWSSKGTTYWGQPHRKIVVPKNSTYLRGFVTLPKYRGRGIYPHLLQEIITQELKSIDQFWILHHFSNTSSKRGIEKAGFVNIGNIVSLENGNFTLATTTHIKKAKQGAKFLSINYSPQLNI